LARLRLTKYRFDDVPTGFTIGQNLVGYRRTDMSWVVVAGYAPEQVAVFKTRAIAAAHIFAFAPPVGFAGLWSYDRPTWVLHVGPDTLDKRPRLEDLIYVDRDDYYAGGAIVGQIHAEGNTMADYRRLLVKGAWMHRLTGACEAFFYLLVPHRSYSSAPRAICPGRWIISEHNHEEIDCRFQNSTSIEILHRDRYLNLPQPGLWRMC
jgi:hypothetical protein